MNQQTPLLFSQMPRPLFSYNPQPVNYNNNLLSSQRALYPQANLLPVLATLKARCLQYNLLAQLYKKQAMASQSIMSPSDGSNFFNEINSKINLSPASYTTLSTSEGRKDGSDNEETFESPQLSQNCSVIKTEFSEDINSEKSSNLMKQSKKIKKEKITPSKAEQNANQDKSIKRRRWTAEEDARLLVLFEEHGASWTKIASLMSGKTGKQVRDRYTNTLRPDIRHDGWTPEEEKLLRLLCEKLGNKWCQIAAYLPGRSENQVKNKYYCQKKKDDDFKTQINITIPKIEA